MKKVLYASFASPVDAEKAVDLLLSHGIKREEISLVINEGYVHQAYADLVTTEDEELLRSHFSGLAKGAGIGLGLGILAGLGLFLLPGIGIVLGAGTLATALGTAGITTVAGATAGSILGVLMEHGMPSEVAHNYGDILTEGGAILAVTPPPTEKEQNEIHKILLDCSGKNLSAYAVPFK